MKVVDVGLDVRMPFVIDVELRGKPLVGVCRGWLGDVAGECLFNLDGPSAYEFVHWTSGGGCCWRDVFDVGE